MLGNEDSLREEHSIPTINNRTLRISPIQTGSVQKRLNAHAPGKYPSSGERKRNTISHDHVHHTGTSHGITEDKNNDILEDFQLQPIEKYLSQSHVGLRRNEFRDSI